LQNLRSGDFGLAACGRQLHHEMQAAIGDGLVDLVE
jgi:hypothetical protein